MTGAVEADYLFAGAGRQFIASLLDMLIVLVPVGIAAKLTDDIAFVTLVLLEFVLVQWGAEGTRGISFGKALLGMRSVRILQGSTGDIDAVLPPGLGMTAVRYLVMTVAYGCALLPGVLLAASPLFDRGAGHRGWLAKLTGVSVLDCRLLKGSHGLHESLTDGNAVPESYALPGILPAEEMPEVDSAPSGGSPFGHATMNDAQTGGTPPPVIPAETPRRRQLRGSRRSDSDISQVSGAAGSSVAVPTPRTSPRGDTVSSDSRPAEIQRVRSQPQPNQSVGLYFEDGSSSSLDVPAAIVLGRSPTPVQDAGFVLALKDTTKTLSRNHALLEATSQGLWVTDLGSTNGSAIVLNGNETIRLAPHVRTPFESGSRLMLGDVYISVMFSRSRRKGE